MLLKIKNKIVTILAVIAATMFLSVSAFGIINRAFSDAPVINPDSITTVLDDYALGETLSVPQSVEIQYNNNTYTSTSAYIYTPNGNVVNATNFVLTDAGVYRLVYFANVNGKTISAEKTFRVSKSAYELNDNIQVEALSKLSVVNDSQLGGLKVSIPNRATFEWGEAINLAELGSNNAFLTFSPYQFSGLKATNGKTVSQAKTIYVKLTDAYNPTSYVTYKIANFTASGDEFSQMPSFSVGAQGQPIRAMSEATNRETKEGELLVIENKTYFVNYQTWGGYPLRGKLDFERGSLISLYYDVDTQKAYVSERIEKDEGEYKKYLVNDLDATEIYSINAFKGFSSGEVYLSVYAEHYQSASPVDLEIASIGNYEGAELYANKTLPDTTAPIIEVEISQEQIDNQLFVLHSSSVRLPAYNVYDINMKSGGKHSIIAREGDPVNGQMALVKDGVLETKKPGTYFVSYVATDDFGNTSTVDFVVNSLDRAVWGESVINFNVDKYTNVADVPAGAVIELPKHSISTPNTFYNVKGYYYFDGKSENKVEFDLSNPEIQLENVGKYTIVYEYSDCCNTGSYSYDINTVASTDFVFTEINVPKYFIKNAVYTLDDVFAKTFATATPELKLATVYASFDGGAFNKINHKEFTSTGDSTVQFKYTYTNGTKTKSVYSDVCQIVNTNFVARRAVYFENYFVPNVSDNTIGATVSVSDKNEVVISATGSKASPVNASTNFINIISVKAFEFTFNVQQANLDVIEIVLTDAYNPAKSVVMQVSSLEARSKITVNGNSVVCGSPLVGTNYRFYYDKSTGGLAEVNIPGTTFEFSSLFDSDFVYVTLNLKGVYGDSSFTLTRINGQAIVSGNNDRQKPNISYDTAFVGDKSMNSIITISRAFGSDVVCPNYYTASNFTVSFEYQFGTGSSDFEFVQTTDGRTIDKLPATEAYQVQLTKVGQYVVTYEYKDQNNQSAQAFDFVYVTDEQAPTITLADGFNEATVVEETIGGIHEAKDYIVVDDVDTLDELTIVVCVFDPMENMIDLIENNFENEDMTFELNLYGSYRVVYYAQDSSGNINTLSYTVFVK